MFFSANEIKELRVTKFMKTIFALMLFSFLLSCRSFSAAADQRNRAIILTDIEADPDDTESLVRLLLYSNVIDIKGLIATTSTHQRNNVYPESILRVIQAYGKVQANLLKHEPGFPEADALRLLVMHGVPEYGMRGVGDGKDSPGSKWIIKTLEENDARPLWICVWGGPNTLAQALYEIRRTKSAADAKQLISKLRVYTISDQDDSGIWMRKNFPDLFYIVSPGGYGSSTWSAINSVGPAIRNEVISNRWLAENIQQGHGPLGALYPDVAYGMEGDTPSWLNLVPNGLSDPEHPDWGGWGGDTNCIRLNIHLWTQRASQAVCLWNPNRGQCGPMQLIDLYRTSRVNMAGQFFRIQRLFQVTRLPCGDGEKIFKMILPLVWTGARSLMKKPIIHQFPPWLILMRSP
jgi:hypothetical protein